MTSHNAHQFQVRIKVIEAHGLAKRDKKDQSDPFVQAKLKGIKQMMSSVKTVVMNNNPNPVWNQELDLFVPSVNDVLLLKVYDKDAIKSSLLGMVEIPLSKFYQGGSSDQWLQLMKRKGGWKKMIGQQAVWSTVPGSLHVQIWFGNTADVFPGFQPASVGPMNSGVGMMGMNSGVNSGMNTGVNSGMNTGAYGMNSGSNYVNRDATGMNSTPMMATTTTTATPVEAILVTETTTVAPVSSTGSFNSMGSMNTTPMMDTTNVASSSTGLEAPNYHADDWSSKDVDTGFQPVSPARFNWYHNSSVNSAMPL